MTAIVYLDFFARIVYFLPKNAIIPLMEKWRLIRSGQNSGSYNMAADHFMLKSAEAGNDPPILRIYDWDVPTITIGFHQMPEKAVDLTRLGETPLVRRITGGRALYHDEAELTYAFAGNFLKYPQLGDNLNDSYRTISDAIHLFYGRMGWKSIVSRFDRSVPLGGKGGLQKGCFSSVSRYEITIKGQKMAAGSQRRSNGAFVQHGAIKLSAPSQHPAIFETESANEIELKSITADFEALAENLKFSFEKIFGVILIQKPFSRSEEEAILELRGFHKNLNEG